jgi:DNA mismatch repair protein MutS
VYKRQGDISTTLIGVLDNTVSPMGARLLKRWIIFPLKDIQKINERLDAVEYLIKDADLRTKLSQHIKQCGDIERLVSKIPMKKINPREVLQLAKGLKQVQEIKMLSLAHNNDYLKRLGDALNPCPYIADKIFKEINENPPAIAAKGGMINTGINP